MRDRVPAEIVAARASKGEAVADDDRHPIRPGSA